MAETVRIACCQFAPDVDNPEGSAAFATAALASAIDRGAQIVLLPELAPTGYAFRSEQEARTVAVPAGGALLEGWAREAARGDALVVGGFCELADDGRLFK